MKICKSCDHNIIIECGGGCFYPHNSPPCFREAMASQTTAVQQLRAKIAALVKQADSLRVDFPIKLAFENLVNDLRQLSAVSTRCKKPAKLFKL